MSDAPSLPFSPQQAIEFMQKMWNPFAMAFPGFAPAAGSAAAPGAVPFPNPAAMFATLDPVEIDRKVAELKVIENWLAMSLSFMQMSIKTLELQRASLEALRGGPAASSMQPAAAPTAKKSRPRTEGR